MTERTYRAAPLTKAEQADIIARYKAGDVFRNAEALSERYNVPAPDIVAVVNSTYTKGRKRGK